MSSRFKPSLHASIVTMPVMARRRMTRGWEVKRPDAGAIATLSAGSNLACAAGRVLVVIEVALSLRSVLLLVVVFELRFGVDNFEAVPPRLPVAFS